MRFFDAHCDAVMRSYDGPFDFVGGDTQGHLDLPRLQAAGHCAQVFAVFAAASYYPDRDLTALAEGAIKTIDGWAAASGGRLRTARSADDVRAACTDGADHIAALIGLEGADPLQGRAENLVRFFELGVRLVIPAWDDNPFSGSSAGPGTGLTDEGIKLVETKIEALGMKCRIRSDMKASLAQGGLIGGLMGAASLPAEIAIGAIAAAATAGHQLATYNPDYEVLKDYVNKKLTVTYKK